ncbi:hypothetical protein GL982_12020 (plasmid) [Spiroplasma citri]|uniref:hypothetical protein n=1 Tax=Spiroplasma citri TaxID=2133 RepID=UPI0013A0A4F8|nr:hypothetical protein [Spiroplasma citri]QIA74255.1 hypothetical protein GL982_12020 [Spiroplasma citri]
MKKLLSILTISTLTASVPAPLLANTPATRTLTSNSNNEHLLLEKIFNSGMGQKILLLLIVTTIYILFY